MAAKSARSRASRRLAVAVALLGAVAAAPAAQAAGFDDGVASGEVGARTAKVWTRAAKAGKLTVQLGRRRSALKRAGTAKASAAHDRTVTVTLRRLRPGTRYFYAFKQGARRSDVGRFVTAPKPGADRTVRFAWSGDADAQPLQQGGPPFWNAFGVYKRMAKEDNAFNVNLGDTIYSD